MFTITQKTVEAFLYTSTCWVKLRPSSFSTCNLFLNVFNSSNICYFILYGLNSSEVELKDPQVHARASDQACVYRSGWIKANMFQVWLVHWITLLIYSALRTNYSVQWEVSTFAWILRFPNHVEFIYTSSSSSKLIQSLVLELSI